MNNHLRFVSTALLLFDATVLFAQRPEDKPLPPAAAVQVLTGRVLGGVALAAGLAVAQSWAGLALAYWTDWPVSFWISSLSAGCYLLAFFAAKGFVRRVA